MLTGFLGAGKTTLLNRILRMKGILAIAGLRHRFALQAVHRVLDGSLAAPWGNEPRRSQLVVIGRELDRAALREGLGACLA